MKTQQEIKDMKDYIQKKIDEIQERMVGEKDILALKYLSDRKHQLMAQYNILLEVLK